MNRSGEKGTICRENLNVLYKLAESSSEGLKMERRNIQGGWKLYKSGGLQVSI